MDLQLSQQQELILQKLILTDYEICIITRSEVSYLPTSSSVDFSEEISQIQNAWSSLLRKTTKNRASAEQEWSIINHLGDRPLHFLNPLIRHFRSDLSGKFYFVLAADSTKFPFYEINLLINYNAIEKGYLPLHSCGLVRNGKLFLFTGPSGAGKSTIARLSKSLGDVVDQDQLIIRETKEGLYSADAWGYSLRKNNARIAAVLSLIQANDERIIPLSPMKTARIVYERSLDPCGNSDSPNIHEHIFLSSSRFARSIPGYELHFRKSPDFWKLIDAEFGLA